MPQQGAIEPLADDELLAVANDPAMVAKFTSEERRRLSRLKAGPRIGPDEGMWEDRGIAGMVYRAPGGASERNRADNSLGGLPPELAVASGLGVMGAMRGAAGMASKAKAGIGAMAGQAGAALKYELVKGALEKVGVPPTIAIPTAIAISGYRRGGAAKAEGAAAEGKAATSPGETAAGGTPPPSGPPPSPAPGAPRAKSPQQILNEEALARRRAEYQARQTAPVEKPALSAVETKEYLRLRVAGKTDEQARAVIAASRGLNSSLNLKTPTPAETKFPKGNRGAIPKP